MSGQEQQKNNGDGDKIHAQFPETVTEYNSFRSKLYLNQFAGRKIETEQAIYKGLTRKKTKKLGFSMKTFICY